MKKLKLIPILANMLKEYYHEFTSMLLIEFLVEELPTHCRVATLFVENLLCELGEFVQQPKYQLISTPRRFGCIVDNVSLRSSDKYLTRIGPKLDTAFHNGVSSESFLKFVKSIKVDHALYYNKSKDELIQRSLISCVNDRIQISYTVPGQDLERVLVNAIMTSIKKLNIAFMKWHLGEYSFIRPVHNLVIMYDNQLLCKDQVIFGLQPTSYTYGHRVHAQDKIYVQHVAQYFDVMKSGYVIANFEHRKQMISQQLPGMNVDARLLDEVTAITEYPVVLFGYFAKDFLCLPQACLTLAMAKHQKYFAIANSNQFAFVANMQSTDPQVVIRGNQRVINARLQDIRFFYESDLSLLNNQGIEYFANKLKQIVQHELLGSVSDRIMRLAKVIQTYTQQINQELLLWCKFDIATLMVDELYELQGTMGRIYAEQSAPHYIKNLSYLIEEHYKPKFSGDELPNYLCRDYYYLNLIDKLELIVSVFLIGQKITGDKDPFGLRRAAIGIIRICIEYRDYNFFAIEPIRIICNTMKESLNHTQVKPIVDEFMTDRLYHYLTQELAYDTKIVKGVIGSIIYINSDNIYALYGHIMHVLPLVATLKTNDAFSDLLAINKRIYNIVRDSDSCKLNVSLITNLAEIKLHEYIISWQHSYDKYIELMIGAIPVVNDFFDNILVNDVDSVIKNNRHALLKAMYLLLNYYYLL